MKKLIKSLTPALAILIYRHKKFFGRLPSLRNPKTFNEKLIYRMRNPIPKFGMMADKYKVRDYIKEKVGDEYLVPLVWQGDSLSLDDYNKLPDSFVLKANHASGTNLIVRDKANHSYESLKSLTNKWLAIDYHKMNLEQHYKYIKKTLIAEKLLLREDGKVPFDYKVHIFRNGEEVKYFIQVDYDRFETGEAGHSRDIFDSNWNKLPVSIEYRNSKYHEPRPECLEKILKLSDRLSEGLGYVRIDWYLLGNDIYFGEATFAHGAGTERFRPEKYDHEWGSYWSLALDYQ